MQFSMVAVLTTLAVVAQCAPVAAPAPFPGWSMEQCAKAKSKASPLLNAVCVLNCKNCVSMKLDCEALADACDI
ncbi:hypothetical protein H072_7799 [Dactylellina haptotyla CBS 200.50]|uniref:Uncharacterized protein n=1 Tax=Dactylellina haptotyla (strain CBS 200.50) TaxID=1284197 RepID=S8ABH1_DACHA|nr:hypothetical protein H072_7799 [Dactylellina haptotyla CBS 200.50]